MKYISRLKNYLVKENDIVLGMDGSKVGKNVALITKKDENAILIQRVARIRAKPNADIKYIYQNIFFKKFHDYVDVVNTSSGIPHISSQQIKDYSFGFPQLPEQTKIANFLTAIDEKIQALKQKKSLLEQYKKGIMQQIFSQELRFKNDDGADFDDWEEKSLGEITEIYDGTHQTPNYVSEGIPFYSVEHITANDFSKTKFITKEVYEKENKRVKLEKGDILMTKIGDIGTSKYIDWDVIASFYVSLALIKSTELNNTKYLNQFFKTEFFQKELHQRIIHVAFPKKINLGEIGNCLVQCPSLPEQQKIATFLSAIDEKIEKVSQQITATEMYKKGLLQQMFI
jgi:type I restriction enzyme S subunit